MAQETWKLLLGKNWIRLPIGLLQFAYRSSTICPVWFTGRKEAFFFFFVAQRSLSSFVIPGVHDGKLKLAPVFSFSDYMRISRILFPLYCHFLVCFPSSFGLNRSVDVVKWTAWKTSIFCRNQHQASGIASSAHSKKFLRILLPWSCHLLCFPFIFGWMEQ